MDDEEFDICDELPVVDTRVCDSDEVIVVKEEGLVVTPKKIPRPASITITMTSTAIVILPIADVFTRPKNARTFSAWHFAI